MSCFVYTKSLSRADLPFFFKWVKHYQQKVKKEYRFNPIYYNNRMECKKINTMLEMEEWFKIYSKHKNTKYNIHLWLIGYKANGKPVGAVYFGGAVDELEVIFFLSGYYRNKGIGEIIYNSAESDILDRFKVEYMIADPINNNSAKFLSKIGFEKEHPLLKLYYKDFSWLYD